MRRIWIAGGALFLSFALLVAAAMQVGERLRPLPAVVARLSDCQPPCWQNIIPGQTSRTAANQALAALGYQEQYVLTAQPSHAADFVTYRLPDENACTVTLFYEDDYSGNIRLVDCADVTLGDVIAALGKPDEILPPLTPFANSSGGMVTSYSMGTGQTLAISFLGGYVIVFAAGNADPTAPWFLPTSPVISIELHPESVTINLPRSTCRHNWQGFKLRLFYTPQIFSALC